MKKLILMVAAFLLYINSSAAQSKFEVYDFKLDPYKQVEDAKAIASKENKNIIIQVGGNWCSWCRLFHKFIAENKKVDSIINANYVYIYVNYSKENKNEKFFKEYKNPGRFGYPVFLILNAKGEILHTQDSGYLEEGKGYSQEKVERMLLLWNPFSTQ